jgi:hypothetical protein
MKATAVAAKAALDAAKSDDIELRAKKIKEAREKLAGAVKYKAPPEFKGQCERLLEVAMLSGGVKAKGPTKAKPLDTAPKLENRAKPKNEAPVPAKPAAPTPEAAKTRPAG